MFEEMEIKLTTWKFVLGILLIFPSTSGDISSFYDDADHYWDFEQSPVSQITDKKTGKKVVTVHGSPETLDSPTGKGIYLQGTSENSSVDLLQVSNSSCLFDPSACSTGLSVAMFVKFRRQGGCSINNTQMFFGNSAGTEFRQGVTIFYDDDRWVLNVTVFGSTNYCFRCLKMVVNSWTHIHLRWKNSGDSEEMLKVFVEGNVNSSGRVTCGPITTPIPTERNYSLGHAAFPVAYFDNVAIWYKDKPPFDESWNYITDFGGNTTLSLTITLWDKQWDSSLSNDSSQEFQSLKNEFINQVK